MLTYNPGPRLMFAINNINSGYGFDNYSEDPYLPMAYHALNHLYNNQTAAIMIVESYHLFGNHIFSMLKDRILVDNIVIFHHSQAHGTFSMSNTATLEIHSIRSILQQGLPEDDYTNIFFDLPSCRAPYGYQHHQIKDVMHECLINLADGDTRDMFVGVSDDDLKGYSC